MTNSSKDQFRAEIIGLLEADDITAIDKFESFDSKSMDFYEYVELVHEYLDTLAFKLRESKSNMNKERLATYIFQFLTKTIEKYDFNEKFVAAQGKTLVTFYKNAKDLDKAIEILEFLIFKGITDNSGQEFHLQLDELYRLRKKRMSRESRA